MFISITFFYISYLKFFILLIMAIIIVPIFCQLPPTTQHSLLPQAIPTHLFMTMGHAYNFLGYSISYTVLYIPMAILQLPICTSQSPHFTHSPNPTSHLSTIKMLSLSKILCQFLLFAYFFKDLIVDRFVFFSHFIVHSFDLLFLE